MVDFNMTILAVAVVFTVLLAIINVMQIIMTQEGIDPLKADGPMKIFFIIVMIALICLMIAHIATSYGNDGVGKNELKVMIPGVLAVIFAITTCAAYMLKDKLADKSQMVYFASLALLWICIIIHIVGRVTL